VSCTAAFWAGPTTFFMVIALSLGSVFSALAPIIHDIICQVLFLNMLFHQPPHWGYLKWQVFR
jgi:hypothetical protein